MAALEAEFPDEGSIRVEWTVSIIGGARRMSWSYKADPAIDPRLSIALLRDVAAELEEDLPDD